MVWDDASPETNFMNAVDTNVLVYSIDADEPSRQRKAIDLLGVLTQRPNQAVLLWQVASEFLNQLSRWQSQNKLQPAQVELAFGKTLSLFPLALPTAGVFQRSIQLRSRHSVSHWDSMLLAACAEAGVSTLYSEDLTDGAIYDTVRVVNPFA